MKRIALLLLAIVGVGPGAIDARAQTWPTKPVRAIVAAGPGSTIDIVPRVVFEQLAVQLGQPIIVENRAGAGGTIAAGSVARSDADGYTLLINSNAHTVAPALHQLLNYHPTQDFAAVIPIGLLPSVLVVPATRGWKSLGDFTSAAKAKPGAMNFSSVGVGSATHLSAERFRSSAKIEAAHVPFKSGAEAMTEVIAGRIDFFFGPVGLVAPNIKDAKLTALVVNSAKRSATLPEVPTTQEAGLSDAEYPFWIGMFLPTKTPKPIVEKLHREMLKALEDPKVQDKLASMGVEPMLLTPSAFDALLEKEIALNAALVKAIGLKAN